MSFKKYCSLGALSTLVLLAACSSQPEKSPDADARPTPVTTKPAEPAEKPLERPMKPGDAILQRGVEAYDNGDYKTANQDLLGALDAGITEKADQVRAYKYLAFIACAGRKLDLCRSHFKQALLLDPSFELVAPEAGHPIWGPVFREVKASLNNPPKIKKKVPAPAKGQKPANPA